MQTVQRVGAFLEVRDGDGLRHFLRVNSIQALSDTDPLQNETLITAGGRTIMVPEALDRIVRLIVPRPGERG